MLGPGFPGGSAGFPEVFELSFVPERVHGLPEAVMLIGRELTIFCKLLDRRTLKARVIAFDVIEDVGF